MNDITTSVVSGSVDNRLRGIADRVVAELQLTSLKAAMNVRDPQRFPLPTDQNALEHTLAARLRQMPAPRQAAATAFAESLVSAPAAQRTKTFGSLADVDLTRTESVAAIIGRRAFPAELRLDPAEFVAAPAAAAGPAAGPAAAGPAAPAFPIPFPFRTVRLRMHRVNCLDETGRSYPWIGTPGSDEIILGGTTVDETGDVTTLPTIDIGTFDSGHKKDYRTPKALTQFSLAEGSIYPKSYFVHLVLAEEDQGGTSAFVNKLLDAIKDRVAAAIAKALSDLVGGGPALAKVLEPLIRDVVARVFAWFGRWWGDDIFPVATVRVDIPSRIAKFPGNRTDSVNQIVDFRGHKGHYQLTYDWQLVA